MTTIFWFLNLTTGVYFDATPDSVTAQRCLADGETYEHTTAPALPAKVEKKIDKVEQKAQTKVEQISDKASEATALEADKTADTPPAQTTEKKSRSKKK